MDLLIYKNFLQNTMQQCIQMLDLEKEQRHKYWLNSCKHSNSIMLWWQEMKVGMEKSHLKNLLSTITIFHAVLKMMHILIWWFQMLGNLMESIIQQICLMLEFLKKLHKLAQEKNIYKIIIETYLVLMKILHLPKESKVDKIGNQHRNHL